MSTSPLLPSQNTLPVSAEPRTAASTEQAPQVFNLVVFVKAWEGAVVARAANLAVPEVRAATMREALSGLVQNAKSLIEAKISQANTIPWTDPPSEPGETESRFVVPLHL
ncbi:MAG: hypothetical protein NXI32_23165 [bacterium]|nr:hypothetical protein [bacterium]